MTNTVGELELKCGARVLVDPDTWEWARHCRLWLANGYPARHVRKGRRRYGISYLHREILGNPEGREVHHIDRNPLNAQRSNLRAMTKEEHRREHRQETAQAGGRTPAHSDSRSGLKGVSWHPRHRKWQATIQVEGRNLFLGRYDDPQEAGLIYDAAVLAYRGGQGYMNLLTAGDG